MRPASSTPQASSSTSDAPLVAMEDKWAMCQSVAAPCSEEYWHIGDTTMRLGNCSPRRASGWNKAELMA